MELVKNLFRANFITTGLAMFAMFFGSGNLIFPVAVGQVAGENNHWALAGLFITAIFLPFFTLCLMLLYNGDYHRFFAKIGKVPGKIVAFTTLALIGPFGVLPRCIAVSYSTFSLYFEDVNIGIFSLISCVLIFLLTYKKNDVVGIIGNFLTPILLVSLAIIIFRGLSADPIGGPISQEQSNLSWMSFGFVEGYKTFDIFAALFFATAIIPAFRTVLGPHLEKCQKSLLTLAIKSSLVGMALLFVVYGGLSMVAANLSGALTDVSGDKLLGTISTLTMGNIAGLIANLVVMFACLTTAISLALVSAEFFRRDVFFHRVSYEKSLLLTMLITLAISMLGFDGIMRMVLPILKILCPAVIALVIASGLNHFFGFRYIKAPVYLVFVASIVATFLF